MTRSLTSSSSEDGTGSCASHVDVLALGCSCELERKHRVAARRGVDRGHRRTREADVEPLMQEPLKVPDPQRPDGDLGECSRLEGVRKSERVSRLGVTPQGREDADRLLADPTYGKREHACRRGVEPLDVVDRE